MVEKEFSDKGKSLSKKKNIIWKLILQIKDHTPNLTNSKCESCNGVMEEDDMKICKICRKLCLRSVKWHVFVHHMVEDREKKGTLFPLLSMEEEGEH